MNRRTLLKRALALAVAPSAIAKLPAASVTPAEATAAGVLARTAVSQYNYESFTRIRIAEPGGAMFFRAGDIVRNELTGEKMIVEGMHPWGLTVRPGAA